MLFDSEDEAPLKKWIVKRLEDISDADSDVLADYVLALLRHESPETEVRKLSIEQLEDFLKESTADFVDDIFNVIKSKSYLPGFAANPGRGSVPSDGIAVASDTSPFNARAANTTNGGPKARKNHQSLKRGFNDGEGPEAAQGNDGHAVTRHSAGDRPHKQPRRGGRNGRHDAGVQHVPGQPAGQDVTMTGLGSGGAASSPPMGIFPSLPQPPPGFPFNPNDPMAAIMAMQAMGFPPLPGMPPFPSPASPSASALSPLPKSAPAAQKKKKSERCRDYDQKGFCALGSTCPYTHGNDHIIVPGQNDEYDPSNASLVTGGEQSPTDSTNGPGHRDHRHGSERGRGRGRGRGAGGAQQSNRRGRAEFSQAGPNQDRSITTVVVENIPEEKFDEQAVREFFESFGVIEDVQMQAYKRLALVKYSDWASAKQAYESPRVIFDNRFVKVYWYKPGVSTGPRKDQERPGARSPVAEKSPEQIEAEMEEIRKKQAELQKAHEAKLEKIKAAEESRRELERRREELLKGQAELAARMGARTGQGVAKASSPTAAASPGDGQAGDKLSPGKGVDADAAPKPKSKTEALRAQLAALEAEAKNLGIDSSLTDDPYAGRGGGRGRGRGTYRGRGAFVPRGRGGYDAQRGGYRGRGGPALARGGRGGGAYKLDNRTKRVTVSGVEFNEKNDEGLRQYLLGIGEFENIERNPDRGDSQIITFKDRFTAEKFVYGPTEIPSVGKVEMAWLNTPAPPSQPPTQSAAVLMDLSNGQTNTMDESMHEAGGQADEMQKNTTNEDYDVAEDDDDRWMVG
ncbi:MAG: hypothetical protein M1825_005593 [Sarcosagium campestre]|nr:MAG: hypothetical protein M1825_005593 [Sarcosagium campestre]